MESMDSLEKRIVVTVFNHLADKMYEKMIVPPEGSPSDVMSWMSGYATCQKDVMELMLDIINKDDDEGPRDTLCQQ